MNRNRSFRPSVTTLEGRLLAADLFNGRLSMTPLPDPPLKIIQPVPNPAPLTPPNPVIA